MPTESPATKGCSYIYEIIRILLSNPASFHRDSRRRRHAPHRLRRHPPRSRQPVICFPSLDIACLESSMNHTLRFTPAAALACALSLSTPSAWSDDALTAPITGTNLFRAERRAAKNVRSGRDTRPRRFAAQVKPNPFDTPDARELRVSGDRLTQHPSAAGERTSWWPANRVALGAGGSDSFGRAVPVYERRRLDWDAYLRANGSPSATRGTPPPPPPPGADTRTRWFDPSRGVAGAPNPFDPSAPQPHTRMFYNNGAGSRCTATAGAGTSRSACDIKW
ncbi:hypothetical protein ACV229_25610 [Burkholderia sp. MR1-5-21]